MHEGLEVNLPISCTLYSSDAIVEYHVESIPDLIHRVRDIAWNDLTSRLVLVVRSLRRFDGRHGVVAG
jgi:hypothetical protein